MEQLSRTVSKETARGLDLPGKRKKREKMEKLDLCTNLHRSILTWCIEISCNLTS